MRRVRGFWGVGGLGGWGAGGLGGWGVGGVGARRDRNSEAVDHVLSSWTPGIFWGNPSQWQGRSGAFLVSIGLWMAKREVFEVMGDVTDMFQALAQHLPFDFAAN